MYVRARFRMCFFFLNLFLILYTDNTIESRDDVNFCRVAFQQELIVMYARNQFYRSDLTKIYVIIPAVHADQ